MNEREFRDRVHIELSKSFPDYIVKKGDNLLYKLLIDAQGKLQPSNFTDPKRGQLAFQTDIVIRNNRVPLVVIEMKFGRFTTHDVLTYSTKAMKHKEVYPYLRYGLVVGGKSRIDRKFFVHNSGFDFALAMRAGEDDFEELAEVIKKQLEGAENLLDVLETKEARKYVANVEIS